MAEFVVIDRKGTDLANAQCDTIRLKLFKIGARIRVTARKVRVSLSSGYPMAALFAHLPVDPPSSLPTSCG